MMSPNNKIFQYCERGLNPHFWAEPLNATTNVFFILAALVALIHLLNRPREMRHGIHYLLIFLVFAIGIGSFLFHTHANRWSSLADVIPIGLFMLVYLGTALNRFLHVSAGWTALLIILFACSFVLAIQLRCIDSLIPVGIDARIGKPCFNGSIGYVPALLVMLVIGGLLLHIKHISGPYIMTAGFLFFVSLTFRSLDWMLCNQVATLDHKIGTHFAWHTLNALILFLLLKAVIGSSHFKPHL